MPTYSFGAYSAGDLGQGPQDLPPTVTLTVTGPGATMQVTDADAVFDDEDNGGGQSVDADGQQSLASAFDDGTYAAGHHVESVYVWDVVNQTTGEIGKAHLIRIYEGTDVATRGGQLGEYQYVFTIPVTQGDEISLSNPSYIGQVNYADLAPLGSTLDPSDGVVTGSNGDDLIDPDYTGDPQGDRVDANDNAAGTNDDVIDALEGNDTVHAGAGNDLVYGGLGNDVVDGGEGDDAIFGGAGDDTLSGGAGNDTLIGNIGGDLIYGGDDADTVRINEHDGTDTLYGGSGGDDNDTLDLSLVDSGVSISFSGDESGSYNGNSGTVGGFFDDFENFQTGSGNDGIYATSSNADLTISTGAGNDEILSGGGDDTIDGGADNDLVYGGAGNDSLTGNTGDDYMEGGEGNDTLTGDEGNDFLRGDAGNDFVYGGDGNDSVYGGAGEDLVHGGDGDDEGYGGYGNDTVYGGSGNDTLTGSSGDDVVHGDDGDDFVRGSDGADTLYGGEGADTLWGEDDADVIYGGAGDHVDGGETVTTGTDDDTLIVTNVNYVRFDPINQENGTVYFNDGTLMTFENIEHVVADGNEVPRPDFVVDGTAGDDNIDINYVDADGDRIDGSDNSSGNNDDLVQAGAGNDHVASGEGNDTVYGGTGDDTVAAGTGNDIVHGDEGNDVLSGGMGDDTLYGGAGNDSLNGDAGQDSLVGGAGDDTFNGGAGQDTIVADDGNDSVLAGDGKDLVYGGAGEDTLIGQGGSDTIDGGDGNDVIYGGGDESVLPGGLTVWANDPSTIYRIDIDETGAAVKTAVGPAARAYGDIGMNADGTLYGVTGGSLYQINTTTGAETYIGAIGHGAGGNALSFGPDSMGYGANGNSIYRFDPAAPANSTLWWTDPNGGYPAGDFLFVGDAAYISWNGYINGPGSTYGTQLIKLDLDTDGNVIGQNTLGLLPGTAWGLALGPNGEIFGVAADPASGQNGLWEISVPNPPVADPSTQLPLTLVHGSENNTTYWGATSNYEAHMGAGADAGDSLSGGAGNDSIYGGFGNDTLDGGVGNDLLYGGADDDLIHGELGDDTLYGGVGNDSLLGGDGNDVHYGGDGDDVINPVNDDAGNDTVYAGSGNDTVYIGTGDDSVEAGDGDDLVSGGAGNDFILGEAGNDTLSGGDDQDTIYGGTGNDHIFGGDQNDLVHGGEGDDTVQGDQGDDVIYGDAGNDTLYGGTGNDTLYGGEGNDYLQSDDGDDSLEGGAGNDRITAGIGNDTVDGGDGDDVINTQDYYGAGAPDRGLTHPTNPLLSYPADADPNNDRDLVYGGAGNDTITTGDDDDTIYGGSGNDSINAGYDDDLVEGGSGNDTILGNEGADTIHGGEGDDLIYGGLNPASPEYTIGVQYDLTDDIDPDPENNRDLLFGGEGNDTIHGQDDADTLYGGTGNDLLDGGIDNDHLMGDEGDDTLLGGHGDDTLEGGTGNDQLFGGAGNDLLYGGAGADTLSGDDDRDTFVNVGIGDVVDGGEGGDDYDTLDLRDWGKDLTNIIYDPTNPENGVVEFLDANGNVIGTMTFSNIEKVIPCFTPGSLIATARGEVAVERLEVGDLVLTRDNGYQPVRWVGRRDLTAVDLARNPNFAPVRIARAALGTGLPQRDMLVSPQHRMLITSARSEMYFGEREVLVSAIHLAGQPGIAQVQTEGISYIHIAFDQHEIIRADGAWTESFQPGDLTLAGMDDAQRNELLALFPELLTGEVVPAARRCLKAREARVLLTA